jgi:H+-transporting ATPase
VARPVVILLAVALVLGAGLVMTGHAVLTPLLQALSMLAGDLVTMSRAADRARPSQHPKAWRVRNLTIAAIPLGVFKLLYCVGLLAAGWFVLQLNPSEMHTLTFLMLVLAGQANVCVLRERLLAVTSRPSDAARLIGRRGDR